MKKGLFLISVLLVSFSVFVFIPVTAEIDFYYKSRGEIWFKTNKIQLRYDSKMYCKVFYNKDEQLLSLNDKNNSPFSLYGTSGRPYLQIDTTIPENFNLENYTGRKESLEGIKKGNDGIPIIDVRCRKMGIGIGLLVMVLI